MLINIENVEELVFLDSELRSKLPDMELTFRQWRMGRIHGLKSLVRQAVFDFLRNLKVTQLKVLEDYFGEDIVINNVDYSLVKNIEFEMNDVFIPVQGYSGLATYREGTQIYISFWR